MSRGDEVQRADLPDTLAAGDVAGGEAAIGGLVSLDEIEREHVRRVVARTSTLEEAARVLGIDGATLYRKRKRWAAGPAESASTSETKA